ncbi:MAG TPA: MFS transporter, partial [Ilumatobacteraceae bacterium]|nr:MFS transporter [Ilumatobacteraceae bacterium]
PYHASVSSGRRPPVPATPPVPMLSPFKRLARTHALVTAGDVAMVVSLAGSLFFSISPDAARSKVLLYLLVSFAPFAVVAPFIGPFIDRAPGGRRFIIQLTAIGRALLFAIMIFHLDDLLLFPLSFGVLILQKTYSVSRSSLIPTVVNNKTELVEANSKLGLISGAVGALAAAPAGALAAISPKLSLLFGIVVFLCAVVAAMKLPRGVVAQSPQPAERMELRNVSLRSAAVAMSLIRAVIGFLFFELLFWLRENHYNNVWIGAVIGASTAGLMLGNGLASPLRSRLREELMLTAAMVLVAVSGLAAAMFGGVGAAIVLAAVANLASGIGRMAFDSIVQRDAPDANQGRAFAKFETRFQLSWALAGVIPVLLTFPGRAAFLTVGLVGVLAVFLFTQSARARLRGKAPGAISTRRPIRGGRPTTPERRSRPRSAGPSGGREAH